MASLITNANSLTQGILRDLHHTWKNVYPDYVESYKRLFYMLPNNNIRSAEYGFKESLPMPQYWGYNEEKPHKSFQDRSVTVSIFPYGMDLEINMFDADHDQIGDAETHMNYIVKRYLTLPSKFFAEHLNGAANFLPSLGTAYDGVGLFNATDGDGCGS